MSIEYIPIGELKQRLMSLAESGHRINHAGDCLFAGFSLNKNWEARGAVLKDRLERLVVEGARFIVFEDLSDDNPITNWVEKFDYIACKEPVA